MSTEPVVLVSATANRSKLAEIRRVLGDAVVVEERPADVGDVVEDAGTFVGNARLKAQAILHATGRPALADDSGLEVDALDGEPGVDAAYYAGPEATAADNRRKLLAALDGVAPEQRTARMRSLALIAWPDGSETVTEGTCEGRILETERGDGGFGYDSLFVPDAGDGRTFAEMSLDEKHALSHRRQAFERLLESLAMRRSGES